LDCVAVGLGEAIYGAGVEGVVAVAPFGGGVDFAEDFCGGVSEASICTFRMEFQSERLKAGFSYSTPCKAQAHQNPRSLSSQEF
jgi:hypothetical protein